MVTGNYYIRAVTETKSKAPLRVERGYAYFIEGTITMVSCEDDLLYERSSEKHVMYFMSLSSPHVNV